MCEVIFLTGLSGSGKSTLAEALKLKLALNIKKSTILDGDKIRNGLCSDLGFSREDRQENIRRIAEVAKLMAKTGITVIIAFISPYKEGRETARQICNDVPFYEVYIDCPVEECEERDPKGLYKAVREGSIKNFTGIDDPYEPPDNPDVHVNTKDHNIQSCVDYIFKSIYA